MKHNWQAAEEFFLNAGHHSGVSLKEISKNFNIPYQSVRFYAAKQQWHSKRLMKWYLEQGQKLENSLKGL